MEVVIAFLVILWFAIPVVALILAFISRSEIRTLKSEVEKLNKYLDADFTVPKSKPERVEKAVSMKEENRPKSVETVQSERKSVALSEKTETISTTEQPAQSQELPKPKVEKKPVIDWETVIGEKWLNRIGILALLIGSGYGFTWLVENGYLSEWIRVIIGIVAGLVSIFAGERFYHKKLPIFGQGLIGLGIGILYLSVYASFNFYGLVSQTIAFFLMMGVTAVTFWQAIRHNSQVVGLFGWLGGFLTPLLISTGEANALGLFGYLFMLNMGLAAIVWYKKSWQFLEAVTILASYFMFLMWFGEAYEEKSFWIGFAFLVGTWALFLLLDNLQDVVPSKLPTVRGKFLRNIISFGNGILFIGCTFLYLYEKREGLLFSVLVGVGVLYLALWWLQESKKTTEEKSYRWLYLGILALAGGSFAPVFTHYETIIALSVLLFLVSILYRWLDTSNKVYRVGFILGLFSLLSVGMYEHFWRYVPIESFELVFNQRFLSSLTVAVMLLLFGWLKPLDKEEKNTHLLLFFGGIGLLLMLFCIEAQDYFWKKASVDLENYDLVKYANLQKVLMWSIICSLFGFSSVWIGRRIKESSFVFFGGAVLALSLFLLFQSGVTFSPITKFNPVLNQRFFAFIVFGVATVGSSLVLGENASTKLLRTALRIMSALSFFLLFTGEIIDYFELQRYAVEDVDRLIELRNMEQLSLSGIWLFYSILLMVIGIWRKIKLIRIASIVLFAVTILKVFIFDLSFLETPYRIISFMSLGIILVLTSYLYQKNAASISKVLLGNDEAKSNIHETQINNLEES